MLRNSTFSAFARATITASAAAILTMPAHATKPPNWTDAEVLAVAPFCPDTMGFRYGDAYSTNTSPNAKKWVGMMGQYFWHMHHYCWARMNVTRSMRAGLTPQARYALRADALTDYAYVIRNSSADFVMLPEVFMRQGETFVLMERYAEAEKSFAQAVEKKPDFWPPYLRWANLLKSNGDRKRAIEVAQRGLQQAPDAQPLRQLLKELGGTPLPPLPRTASTPAAASSSPVATQQGSAPSAEASAPANPTQ